MKGLPALTILLFTGFSVFSPDTIPLTGSASFYSKKFTGRRTSSGEVYSPKRYTCAHRSLPFGTMVKVTNPENNRSVVVKVNDRGGFYKKRIVDLSLAAAKDLGIVSKGHAMVNLEVVSDSISSPTEVIPVKTKRKYTSIRKSVRLKPGKNKIILKKHSKKRKIFHLRKSRVSQKRTIIKTKK